MVRLPGHVLDGSAGKPRSGGQADGFVYIFGIVPQIRFQIAVDRQIRSGSDHRGVGHRLIASKRVIGLSQREGTAGAGCSEGFEAQMRQQASGSSVPGIGNEECARALMEPTEGQSVFGLRRHGGSTFIRQRRRNPEGSLDSLSAES